MGTIYDNTEIYDIGFDEKKWQIVKEHWKKIFDGTKVNTSEALKANKVVNGVEFSDIQLTQKSGETMITATVKNTGSAAVEMFAVDVTLIDDAGQDIVTVGGLVAPMEAGATASFETSMTLDYANSYDFRVTAK